MEVGIFQIISLLNFFPPTHKQSFWVEMNVQSLSEGQFSMEQIQK